MPHIIIEHSLSSLNKDRHQILLNKLFKNVEATGLFNTANIKVRLNPTAAFRLATDYDGFIHTQCRIHTGRSQQDKQRLSDSLLLVLKEFANKRTVITVEVIEMDSTSYTKTIT